jgi:heat induced stress protein YflT
MGATPTTDIASPHSGGETVSTYGSYQDAERAVDYLSDHGFPVENAQIVGSNLRLVEQVTGRVTTGRATLAGAGSGTTRLRLGPCAGRRALRRRGQRRRRARANVDRAAWPMS